MLLSHPLPCTGNVYDTKCPQWEHPDLGPTPNLASALPRIAEFAGTPLHVSSIYTDDLGSDRATADTVAIMRELAWEGSRSPIVHEAVERAWAQAGLGQDPSDREVARAMYGWVRRNIQFVEDETLLQLWTGEVVSNKELLLTPERLLTMNPPQGDCDDFSTLLASMLLVVGIPTSFVTIAADPATPDRFSHVYVRVNLPRGEILNLDASHGPYLGWESPEKYREVAWTI